MDQQAKLLRDEIRARTLAGTNKVRSKVVSFHGVDIEIREQTLAVALGHIEAGNDKDTSPAEKAIRMLIDYAYVPGFPDTKVYDVADIETLKGLPFNADWINVQNVIAEMMGLTDMQVKKAEEELLQNPLAG